MKPLSPAVVGKAKSHQICVNILSSLNTIELLQYDLTKHSFIRVDVEPFLFDPSTREPIPGTPQLKQAIKHLYERNKISFQAITTLVVPSFFTRQYSVPDDLMGEDLKTILISEAERFYVFKKIDPMVGYGSLGGNQVLYTAYPKQALEALHTVFTELKIPLADIDCSYTATLRGLVAMGVAQEELQNHLKWGLLIVSDFTVFMAVVDGLIIEKMLEAPLPVQNTQEALLNEICNDFGEFFSYEVLSRLAVVNNSTLCASVSLLERLQFQGPTDVFDQNEKTLNSLGSENGPFPCSLEAVGGALTQYIPEIPTLNLGDPSILAAMLQEDRKKQVAYALIIMGMLIFAAQWGAGIMLESWTQKAIQQGNRLQTEINTTISALSVVPEAKLKLYIKQGVLQNQRMNNVLVKIHQALPHDAWLEQVSVNSAPNFKALDVSIQGGTLTSDALNTYIKELNKEVGTPVLVPTIVPQQENNRRFFKYTLSNHSEKTAKTAQVPR